MKNKALLLSLVISTMIFSGCEGDLPPEKTVGNITFVITEENTPQTLSGVSIQLFSDDNPSVTPTDRTDASGRCTFSNIPIGSYHLNLSKPGYESKEGLTLRVNGGDNPYKEISLKRATTTLTVAPEVLDFGDNASVVQKAFSLVNPNYIDLEWSVQNTDVKWIISVCDKNGRNYGTTKYNEEVAMSVTIDRSKLTVGNNESTIVILSDYGRAELKVKAVGTPDPSVYMSSVSSIGFEDALLTGKIVEEGVPPYKNRGFVVNDKTGPSVNDNLQYYTFPASSSSEFTQKIKDLKPNNKYYVRAFAINEKGTFYSNELEFTTKKPEQPSIGTVVPDDIYEKGATLNGLIGKLGNPAFTKVGFVISPDNNEPTIENGTSYIAVGASSIGAFEQKITELANNKTYYVRAYAVTPYETVYFNVVQFATRVPYISIGSFAVRLNDEDFIEKDYSGVEVWRSKMSHYDANKACNNLILGTYDDWRLPTLDELRIIYNHRNEIGGFSSDLYWTSTKNKDEGNYEGGAWDEGYVAIDFATGEVKYNNPYVSYSYKVRAVRSLQ